MLGSRFYAYQFTVYCCHFQMFMKSLMYMNLKVSTESAYLMLLAPICFKPLRPLSEKSRRITFV